MAQQKVTRGVTKNQDLDPALISRDTRTARQKMRSLSYQNESGIGLVVMGGGVFVFPFAGFALIADIFILMSIWYWLFIKGKSTKPMFRIPLQTDSKGNIINGPDGKPLGDGIMYLGNDLSTNAEIWFSADDIKTHMLCFGSTGSGKTRFLLGLLYQALVMGSGALYVDGKGDNTVWWLVFSFCRRVGRIDDLLVINYLTGGGETKPKGKMDPRVHRLRRKSNTNNPLANGTGEQLRSLIVGLMRSSSGDGDMWKGMASALMGGLLKCLTFSRDRGDFNLDVTKLRDNLPLDQIVALSLRTDFTESAIAPIKKYLAELPGYVEDEAVIGRINPKVYEQHGYRIMQFSEVLSDLEDTYGHIFSAPLGEVEFKDVVFNRRILFVMLPALEKDPDALAGLGKMVVAGVRAALAPALGDELEGAKSEVIDKKPTTSKYPFMLILDEYGYYSVNGFAVVAAQARSLGVAVVFAGQDYPSFKRGSEIEAEATIANTNVKIGMKIEDPNGTTDIITKRVGSANIATTDGAQMDVGFMSNYKDKDGARYEMKERVNLRDLVSQTAGQAHVIFADELSRCQFFFWSPVEVSESYLNKFVMVNSPPKTKIDAIKSAYEKLNKIFDSSKPIEVAKQQPMMDEGLKRFIKDFQFAKERKMTTDMSAITAISIHEWRSVYEDEILKQRANGEITTPEVKPKDDKAEATTSVSSLDSNIKSVDTPQELDKNEAKSDVVLTTISDDSRPSISVKDNADEISKTFAGLMTDVISNEIEKIEQSKGQPLTVEERNKVSPESQILEFEEVVSKSESSSLNEADKTMRLLSQRTIYYPSKPTPDKETVNSIEQTLKDLLNRINETEKVD